MTDGWLSSMEGKEHGRGDCLRLIHRSLHGGVLLRQGL